MKHPFQKTFAILFIALMTIGVLGMGNPALAQEEPEATGGDPAVTNLWVINSTPAPGGLVDFTVYFTNMGSAAATDVALRIDYDETQLFNISVGSPVDCRNDGQSIICNYISIDSGASGTVGFTALVEPTVTPGTEIITTASIDAKENDVIRNDFGNVVVTVGAAGAGGVMAPTGFAGIPVADLETGALEEPAQNQGIALFNVQNNPNWSTNALTTAGLKFMIRGKEALAWSLNIEEAGFDSPAIRSSYNKVLTVINSLFIIGLLAIAAMWMFSLLIPRRYLRQVILVYALAVVFVNFAFPLNQLFIDGTNLLQKTFLSGVNITNIAEAPSYNDQTAIGYLDETNVLKQTNTQTLNFKLPQENESMGDVVVGKLEQDFLSPSYTGTLSYLDEDGNPKQETVTLRAAGNDPLLLLKADQIIELINEKKFNPDQEHSIFTFLLMLFTGLAYFGMALVFMLRIVLLWALLIVSPALFLLAVFHATRSYFINWLGVYARWLLIGPLIALGLSIVVGIWKTVGLPVISSYQSLGQFGGLSNIGFYLPGSETINNLSNTSQMMQYLLFLIMLYLPLLFAFMLTRQKLWSSAAMAIAEKREALKAPAAAVTTEKETIETGKETGAALPEGIRGLLGGKFAGFTGKTTMPETLKTEVGRAGRPLETASSFLPEHLALSGMRDMLGLVAGNQDSRHVHGNAIEKLADPAAIADSKEQQNVMAVRQEIESRASAGDPEATRIMNEIKEVETQTFTERETATGEPALVEPIMEVNVNTPKPEKEIKKSEPMPTTKKEELIGEEPEQPEDDDATNPSQGDELKDDEPTDNPTEADEK
ncbi:type IV secretion system protein [Candidatus Peregrinibacteria bacterium]|nr:type IV secretion system protein [Candidatus Peregrinibacteria bacterium]